MAIQSALTGHLVLTTVHCSDAASGAARLIDMGAEPFLVASSATAFLSQRLVRKICAEGRTPDDSPPQALLGALGADAVERARDGVTTLEEVLRAVWVAED